MIVQCSSADSSSANAEYAGHRSNLKSEISKFGIGPSNLRFQNFGFEMAFCPISQFLAQADAETPAALCKQLQVAGWRLGRSTAKGDELRRVSGAIDNLREYQR